MSDIKINRDTFFNLCSLLDAFLDSLDTNTLDKYQKSQISTLKDYILVRDYKGSKEDEKILYTHLITAKKSNNSEMIKKAIDLYNQIKKNTKDLEILLTEKNIDL